MMGTSGRYELDPVSNPTGVTRSRARSLGPGPGLGHSASVVGGPGKIMVENTVAIKYASGDESADGGDAGSCGSVTGLVVGRASAEADESGLGGRSR